MKKNEFISAPSIEQIQEKYGPPAAIGPSPPDPQKEIVAIATACWGGIQPWAFDSHRLLTAQIVQDYGSNAWLIPTHERMPFPDAPLYALCTMFNAEKAVGRKADWFLWVEDDVSVPKDLLRMLRRSADPETRPFMGTVAFIRNAPFLPAVWQRVNGEVTQWHDVPDKGVYEVAMTGFCAVLMHRSLFDRIQQPWFMAGSNVTTVENGIVDIDKGMEPDNWWSGRMAEAGIPIYVDTEPIVTHFGLPIPINRRTAPVLRNITFFADIYKIEQEMCGEFYNRDGCVVYADLRQGVPEGVGGTHGTDGEPGEEVLT